MSRLEEIKKEYQRVDRSPTIDALYVPLKKESVNWLIEAVEVLQESHRGFRVLDKEGFKKFKEAEQKAKDMGLI